MSMCTCQFCGALVDTDDDPEAIYDTDTQRDVIACEPCRETHPIVHELGYLADMADLARAS